MKPYTRNLILLLISLLPLSSVVAQELPQEFSLPIAHVGEDYRAEIASVLREKYQLKLESGNTNAVIRWTIASGEVRMK